MNSVTSARLDLSAAIRVVAACLALVLSGQPSADSSNVELKALDAFIERQEYTQAVARLRRIDVDAEQRLSWLRRHAEAGHPPFQNELAIQLLDRDVVESLKWFARGRLARILDASECGAAGVSQFPDPALERVRIAAVGRPEALLKASDDALEWVTASAERPSSKWMCGSRDLPDRQEKRAAALRDMHLATKRLRNYVNSIEAGKRFPIAVYDVDAAASFIWADSAWVDNSRLLFIASEPPHATPRLFAWDVGQRPPVKLFPELEVRAVCVRAGLVTLVTSSEGRPEAWEGTVDSVRRVSGLNGRIEVYSRLDRCRQRWVDRFIDGARIQLLPGDHGELRSRKGQTASELVRVDGQVVQLPIASFGARVLDYAGWYGAYLIGGPGTSSGPAEPSVSRYSIGADVDLFSLWPDGRTQRHQVPYGVWDTMSDQSTLYRLSRQGLIISGGDLDEDDVDGWNGVFLFPFDGRDAVRLTAGRFDVGDASPDGCRIALSWSFTKRRPQLHVRVIDLCAEPKRAIK